MSRRGGRLLETRAMQPANPVNPQRVTWELSPRLPDGAIITSDSGSCANWYARDLKMRRGMMASLSGGLASMGAAVPYAIAAKFAHPDRPVIALVGDGAMQMNNMAELITVAKYWRDWTDKRWIVCVFNNRGPEPGDLGAARHGGRPEIRGLAADPERALPSLRRADRAQGHLSSTSPRPWAPRGTRRSLPTGPSCSRSRPIPRCRRCRRTSRWTQAKKFTSTLLKGDPDEGGMVRGAARQVAEHGASGERVALRCPASGNAADHRSQARGLQDPDRRAGGRRDLCLGRDHAGRRPRRRRAAKRGLGYTYAGASVAPLIETLAGKVLKGQDAFDIPARRLAMQRAVRNLGRSGLAAMRRSRRSTARSGT